MPQLLLMSKQDSPGGLRETIEIKPWGPRWVCTLISGSAHMDISPRSFQVSCRVTPARNQIQKLRIPSVARVCVTQRKPGATEVGVAPDPGLRTRQKLASGWRCASGSCWVQRIARERTTGKRAFIFFPETLSRPCWGHRKGAWICLRTPGAWKAWKALGNRP